MRAAGQARALCSNPTSLKRFCKYLSMSRSFDHRRGATRAGLAGVLANAHAASSTGHGFAAAYVVTELRPPSSGVAVSSATYGVCRWTGSDLRRTRRLIVSTKSENAIAK